MKRVSWLISRYLLGAVVPYFLFSWVLLTVILFLQQASRYSELFFNVNIPSGLIWQLMIGLIPNVIAFTCPMAVLVGTIIGLSKLQGDSELTAIRAAGVGNVQIAVPIVVLGIVLSLFALFVNIKGVPFAAALVREVAMRSAISKFESPIEPGIFYTEIDGFTILARDSDPQTGYLKRVFISQLDPANGVYRLITSDIGRIEIAGEATELVLENAAVITIPEAELPQVRRSMASGALKVLAKVPSEGSGPREGTLDFVDNTVQEDSGTVRLRAVVENGDRHFWPGQFVEVRLILETLRGVTMVPARALQVGQRGPFVFVVKGDQSVDLRGVKPGQRQGEDVAILEGVRPGETVVVSGQMGLVPGAKVAVVGSVVPGPAP